MTSRLHRAINEDLDRFKIERLQERIAALEEAQRWIPVSERLPTEDTVELYEVIVVRDVDGAREKENVYWQLRNWEIPYGYHIEQWREAEPLPAPPKEQGE